MIRREIVGPQDRFERTGAEHLRDTRPLSTRLWAALMSEASGIVLSCGAIVMFVEPALVDVITPGSIVYTALVLTRRVTLPLRLPQSARMKDYNYPEPSSRRPRMAAGTIYLGRDLARQELWISSEDARQHATVPGTTGAGKTTAIVSFLANALCHGSGFVLVDGKADNKLYGEVCALARRFGRIDDVLCLNLLVASGTRESNTFNPFGTGNADAIRELLASQLGEQGQSDSNGVFRDRAVALIGTITPALVWLRDNKGIPLNIDVIRFSIELRWIWKLAMEKICIVRDPDTGKEEPVSVENEIPEDILWPLKAYLGELPGYDPSLPLDKQKGDEPSKQHGFAQFYFTATFTQLAVSLAHIFRVEQGDIDMRDIVLNRRILVVNLPALENSDATLAALGKLVVSALRGMMAQMLGSRLEGDYCEIVANKPGMGVAPFHVVLDEVAYYAASGMDRMLAMGRGLNIMFWLGFQEVSGIWARIGEKTQSLLGNANLTVAMRQQDADRTRRWLQETAGDTYVTQATSYQGGGAGEYAEARHAEVREVSRVDWTDLQRLIEGEAIILFGGRRIYAKLFHAELDVSGPLRLNRPVALPVPDAAAIKAVSARVDRLIDAIEKGLAGAGARAARSPTLGAMIDAFSAAAAAGGNAETCIAAAIKAAGDAPFERLSEPGAPVTPFTELLESGVGGTPGPGEDSEIVSGSVDIEGLSRIIEIERASGASAQAARETSLSLLGRRNKLLRMLEPRLDEPTSKTELLSQIEELSAAVAKETPDNNRNDLATGGRVDSPATSRSPNR
ncbi:intracellular multiplication protein IcmO [Methylocapsa palsarum]|uniref:Intracellular multiplication protein IcmO n=2 Tax=Methylocapsa palsarum TaxID=1612308 RepID=A0A1I4CJ72_9HYPH|nr:intracellular multiplication protein IcmO [Methylocapsa palsarum]